MKKYFCLTLLVFALSALAVQQITFQPIYFSLNEATLLQSSKEALARVHALLVANPKVTLKVLGNAAADESEPEKLAIARAKAAYDYMLEKFKIAPERLSFEGSFKPDAVLPNEGKSMVDGSAAPSTNAAVPAKTSPETQEKSNESRRVEFVFNSSSATVAVSSKKPLEEINVIYWNTLYHSLYHLGAEKGFFEKEGFKINLIATNHSYTNQVKAACSIDPFLKSGELVFTGAVCGGSPHEAIAQGVPLVIIGGMLSGGSMLIALPETAKKLRANWKNFKGIKIGRPKGTVLTAMIVSDSLKKNGVDPKKDVEWIEFDSHEEIIEAIAQKKIDAGDAYAPTNIQAKKKYGIVEVYNTVELFPYHPCCRVITTLAKLKANPEKYVRFMKAVIRSHEFFVTQPNPSYAIIQKHTGYTMEEVVSSLRNTNFMLNPDPLKKGSIKFWKMMNETGYIHSDEDITKHIDTSIYEKALKQLMAEDPSNTYYPFMMTKFKAQN